MFLWSVIYTVSVKRTEHDSEKFNDDAQVLTFYDRNAGSQGLNDIARHKKKNF